MQGYFGRTCKDDRSGYRWHVYVQTIQRSSLYSAALPARAPTVTGNIECWHRRLSHMNEPFIPELGQGKDTGITVTAVTVDLRTIEGEATLCSPPSRKTPAYRNLSKILSKSILTIKAYSVRSLRSIPDVSWRSNIFHSIY